MTVSKDLLLSILSMDAYNRGYNVGISGLSDAAGTRLGAATIRAQDLPVGSEAASFYAISYTIGSGVDGIASGTTVISYRGTDAFWSELATLDQEISYGGSYQQDEIALALKFYKTVNAANGSSPILTTGHSLGGALAGFAGAINQSDSVLLDHIGFNTSINNLLAGWDNIKAYLTLNSYSELRAQYQIDHGPHTDLFLSEVVQQWDFFRLAGYDGSETISSAAVASYLQGFLPPGAVSYFLSGSVADNTRGSGNPVSFGILHSELGDYTDYGIGSIQAHSISLASIMAYAEQEKGQSGFLNFKSVLGTALPLLFNDDLAINAGATPALLPGESGPAGKLQAALAYSALEGSGLVFGDTGIRAYFDDLSALGSKIVSTAE